MVRWRGGVASAGAVGVDGLPLRMSSSMVRDLAGAGSDDLSPNKSAIRRDFLSSDMTEKGGGRLVLEFKAAQISKASCWISY